MKTCTMLLVIGLLASASWAGVSLQVYRADEQTPLALADPNEPGIYEDIMVGTHLIFVIGSETPVDWWSGGLWLSWDDWAVGKIAGRVYNPETGNYDGSILPADVEAYVNHGQFDEGNDFSLSIDTVMYVGDELFVGDPIAGEWFVLDYYAGDIGDCTIGLYSSEPAIDTHGDLDPVPPGDAPYDSFWIQGLTFHHVPSRDYDGNMVVNFTDFALWAEQWQQTMTAGDPNAIPLGDLNGDAFVDTADLTLFCEYWLERTDIAAPADPNRVDPNTLGTAP